MIVSNGMESVLQEYVIANRLRMLIHIHMYIHIYVHTYVYQSVSMLLIFFFNRPFHAQANTQIGKCNRANAPI